jgi:hypothetical protein
MTRPAPPRRRRAPRKAAVKPAPLRPVRPVKTVPKKGG